MVDLPRLTLSEGVSVTAHNLEITGLQGGSEASQSGKFNKLFKQSINKGATPESGISTPEHGAVLPNNAGQLITLESKSLRGGMSLLVGGDEPTNDVIKEFAQSQGVNAELIALLMKEPSSVSQTKPTSINSAQQVSLLSNKAPLSEEKIPRAMDILSGSVKDTTNQNTLHTAIPSKFIVSESALSKSTVTQTQTVQNSTLPLNLESARLGGVDDDGILIQTKNAEPLALVDATGKRTSVERPDEVLMIKQEQHADMSKRLAEALGQRLTAQISKGVWQVELDIHPKSLGRIEIHLEMKGGELEAHFNASRALTRELLQDGMPRLKEELREHGIETAYLGLGSGKQGTSGGNSTPSGNRNNGEDEDMTVNHAKAAMLEPKGGAVKKLTLIDGLDITI
jgi:flagellar hook-length control protein FliK|tara:strand:- start:8339 stop:9529 length:1191 start_codon:yes stop_codon:yes gene_type:complete